GMAKQGRRPARRSGGRPPARQAKAHRSVPPEKRAQERSVPEEHAEQQRVFRLGAVPGTTPGKWIDAWKQRMPQVRLELVPIEAAGQRDALANLDAALVRLPIHDDALHVIPLYEEDAVVVAAADSHLMAAEEL